MKKTLSVIIPTYNRPDALELCLKSLSEQDYPHDLFEVIVVDDGSTCETQKRVKKIKKDLDFDMQYIYQQHGSTSGVSKARNTGLKAACGDYVLIIGDDVIATKKFISEHMSTHKKNKDIAVLGFTTWYDGINVSDFMKFIMEKGHQFNYKGIDENDCGYGLFYTSNISLSRKWFANEKFDESVYITEDIEMGYRLQKKGLRIVFNRKALAYHNHEVTETEFVNKTRKAGYFSVYMYRKFPEIKNFTLLKAKVYCALPVLYILNQTSKIIHPDILKPHIWRTKLFYNAALGILDGFKDFPESNFIINSK